FIFIFQAEDGIRGFHVTGVQTCALPIFIEPDLAQTFVAIAEAGTFTEAASRVHRTQSAVSMQMRRLEELLGRRLFEKAGRGITRSEEHTSELQSRENLVCRLLLEKKKTK